MDNLVFGLKVPEHSAQNSIASSIARRAGHYAHAFHDRGNQWGPGWIRASSESINRHTTKDRVSVGGVIDLAARGRQTEYSPADHEWGTTFWHAAHLTAAALIASFGVQQLLVAVSPHPGDSEAVQLQKGDFGPLQSALSTI